MLRRIAPILILLSFVTGCAGSSKLSQKSEEKLAGGDTWRAWQLATRALDKEPGNPRARTAATAAGAAIAQDWQRRIRALAEVDSLNAADEVMKLAEFRVNAARYATIPVGAGWPDEERISLESARNRLKVAVSTLRKSGLEPILQTHAKGYLLDPGIPIRSI